MRFPLRPFPFAVHTAAWLVADQLSKLAVVAWVGRKPVTVIPGVFDLVHRANPGGAWGLLADASESFRMPFFVVTSLLAIGVLLLLRPRLAPRRPALDVAFPAILGGALGNLIDRVRAGEVVDFLEVHLGSFTWPTFNVADIGITLGVLAIVLDSLLPVRGSPVPVDAAASGLPEAPPEAPPAGEDESPPVS